MGRVLDRLGQADLDAVDGVDHVLEAVEVQDHVVVDPHVGELLELLDRAGRATHREGLVPHDVGGAGDRLAVLVLAVGTVDQAVARDAHAVGECAVRREVEHDGGVRALPVAGEPVDVVALAVAGVRAHHEQVDRLLRPGIHRDLVGTVGQLRLDVDHVEVVVEVAVEVHPTQSEDQAERGEPRDRDGGRTAAWVLAAAALGAARRQGRRRHQVLGHVTLTCSSGRCGSGHAARSSRGARRWALAAVWYVGPIVRTDPESHQNCPLVSRPRTSRVPHTGLPTTPGPTTPPVRDVADCSAASRTPRPSSSVDRAAAS